MVLKPEDIQRPGVARPRGVSARPSTVQLPKIVQPQAGAISDVAQATRRKASEVDRLAQRRRAAGREEAAAVSDLGDVQLQSGRMLSQARDEFAKTIGGVARTFELIENNRKEADDKAYLDRWELEAAKAGTPVEADHLNSPKEGAEYIQELDTKLSETYEEVEKRVTEELGYEPSDNAKAELASRGFDLRTGAARRSAVAANNARVTKLVTVSDANVLDIARTTGGSGDLALGLQQADAAVDSLEGVLPADKLEARRQAARETVIQATVLGHLERNEIEEARLITDDLTGFVGPSANEIHASIIETAKAEGVDPLLALALVRHETAGKFDPMIQPIGKDGKPLSSAGGLYQFISSTSRAYLGTPDATRATAAAQAEAGARLTADNIRGLKRVLGTEPTPAETYLAHLLGLGKATQILTADPEAKLTDFLTAEQIRNSSRSLKGKTVGDMILWAEGTIQKNMDAVTEAGLIEGRDVAKNQSSIPLDSSIRLNAAVAAKEKQIRDEQEKARKEFVENFSPLKPRPERDPAGWVFKHGSGEVSQAYLVAEKVLADPDAEPAVKAKAWQRALDMSLEEQRALGLSERDAKLLPNDQAKTLVNKLMEAKGPDAARMFYEIRDLTGVHFDKVYSELVDQKLPAEFQVLALLDPIGNPAQVNSVSQVLGVSMDTLKADLGAAGSTIKADLLDPIEEDLTEFRQALEFGPFGDTAKQQAASIIEAAKKVALNHYRLTGDLGEAQERASALINDNIDVMTGPNLNALIPRDVGVSESDIEVVTSFMQTRAQIDLFDPLTIGVAEVESPGALGEAQAEFRRNRTRETAKNYGIWTTNDRSDGLVLLVPAGNGTSFLPLMNENGDPYEIKFSEVSDIAKGRRAALEALGTPFTANAAVGEVDAGSKKKNEGGVGVIEGTFLSALSKAEEMGLGGTSLRLYNEIVQHGRREPISERDFNDAELGAFETVVQGHASATGKKSGHIDYKDYRKYGAKVGFENILGGFDYEIQKDGTILITDKYDFNMITRGASDENPIVKALGAFFAPRELAAKVGRDRLPPGKGVPVKIRLGGSA
jgi:hypothetical protein